MLGFKLSKNMVDFFMEFMLVVYAVFIYKYVLMYFTTLIYKYVKSGCWVFEKLHYDKVSWLTII